MPTKYLEFDDANPPANQRYNCMSAHAWQLIVCKNSFKILYKLDMLAVKGIWDRLKALTVKSKTLHEDALAGSKVGREDTALLNVYSKARDALRTLEQDMKSKLPICRV